jgi:hypothetical protein
MPLSQWQVTMLGLAILAPTIVVARLLCSRNAVVVPARGR